MDDILDIDEVLTDSFYMPSEECYNDIQNIVQQWKDNENPSNNVQNESARYFDTRTFTRQKKRLSSNSNGLADLDYQKSVAYPLDNTTLCRNLIFDSSPSNSLCSYVSDDATSLITSGDFSNISYFINNTSDITLQFNDMDLKKNIGDAHCPSSTDVSQNSSVNRTVTHNRMLNSTIILEKNDLESTVGSAMLNSSEMNNTHTIPAVKRSFENRCTTNSTFDKNLDDTFEIMSGKIAQTNYTVPRNEENYDCLNLIQSTPKYSRTLRPRLSSTPPNLSPITPKKFELGPIVNDKTNTLTDDLQIEMNESINNDDQQNSLVNFEEFEKSIFLDDDKCDEDFETLLDRMGSSRRLENRGVMKESLDNIKKRHSLINSEIKQEHQREKMNHSGDNKSMVSSLQKSIPDERLLRRSRLFDNITVNASSDKIDRSGSKTIHLDSNRTFNNESLHKIGSNQLDLCNTTVSMDKPENSIEVPSEIRKSTPEIETEQPEKFDNRDRFKTIRLFNSNSTVTIDKPENPIEVASEIRKTTPESETEQPEKFDNRDRFKTIRLFKKPATNAVVITDTQTQYPTPGAIKNKSSVAQKHIEPISKLKSRQISTLSTRDSYLKSSSVENLNTRNGFQKLKTDINAGRSSSTQSLDKTTSGLTKTSMLRDRIAAVPKNVKPNTVQNVIPKSLPVFNSRQNVNKLSGLVRPSSGFYSFNTEIEKFEQTNNVQSIGDSTFVCNANHEPPSEPKPQPSRIAKPSGLRQPSKISCLPRPMSKR